MGNNKPLLAHLCLFGSGAFWGLMAPVGKDAMTHGIEASTWYHSAFWRSHPLLAHFTLHPQGAHPYNRHHQVGWSRTLRTGIQPVLLHHRTEHHLAQQFEHHDYIDAYLRHDSVVPHPPRAHHLEEGGWRTLRLQRCRAHHHDKCHGGKCQSGKHLGRLTLHGRTTVVCALSVALQALGGKVFALHHQQVDVHLASVMILPFSASHVASIPWAEVPVSAWWETGYVIFFGTYLGYILMMIGQKTLRPTVVSVYNYVQPLVSVSVSVLVGLAVFKGTQLLPPSSSSQAFGWLSRASRNTTSTSTTTAWPTRKGMRKLIFMSTKTGNVLI